MSRYKKIKPFYNKWLSKMKTTKKVRVYEHNYMYITLIIKKVQNILSRWNHGQDCYRKMKTKEDPNPVIGTYTQV